jgi:hypothetical protein
VTQSRLPDDVRDFLRNHIRSVGELEVLLLLQRDSTRWWTAEQVNRELRTSLESALQHLGNLRDVRLVQERKAEEWEYRFAPDPTLVPIVRTLEALFRDWIASIVDVIYAPRNDSLRDFADAFRLGRKGESNDG